MQGGPYLYHKNLSVYFSFSSVYLLKRRWIVFFGLVYGWRILVFFVMHKYVNII